MHLCGLGRHDAVEPGVLWEAILEGQYDIAIEKQPLAFAGLRHIGELMRGNAQLSGQNFAVACRLIEHVDVVAVFKDVFNLLTG